jgi:thiol:disulfide interchange protein DsbD
MKRLLSALAVLAAFAVPAVFVPAWAQPQVDDGAPKVAARLVAEGAVTPGGKLAVALEEKIRPEWHTYWVNPGDAGAPTSIAWSLPAGWTAGDIQWPTPKRLPVLTLMDYGYEGTLWLISDLTAPSDAKPGQTVTIKAHASWLVCQQICVPEERDLSVDVTIAPAASADAAVAKDFAAARARLPVASPWALSYAGGANVDLYVRAPALASARPTDVAFFPLQPGTIKNAAPQSVGVAKDGLVLRLTPGAKPPKGDLQGLLVLTSSDKSVQALNVSAPVGAVPSVTFAAPATDAGGAADNIGPDNIGLVLAMAFAFLGGLILNVMPCVLPILAMKALALAGNSGRERREAMIESFSYAAGAVGSFIAFGLAVVALRSGGASVGWGFQLQEPLAVAGFALLIFAVGLNLSGLFEVGSVTAGGELAARGGAVGAFFTGVLAVAVAAPCTAPFMAAALGFALTQSALYALAVFFALGVGFAAPFLILGVWPRALSFLPRPGPWMLRLKQFLAFPMYGAAVWLAWVLVQETGANAVPVLAGAAVMLAFAAWLWNVTRDLEARGRVIGLVAAALVLLLGLGALAWLPGTAPASASSGATASNAESFTPEKLASLRAANKPVFVDATAAWCITCLVNEQAVLSRADVKAAFAAKGVTYLVADWTSQNADITKLLAENGRSGVPLYLYYAPGADRPKILSQILTQGEVLGAIGG